MRAALLAPIITLLGLAALPACTVNYYVPAATDAPVASNAPRRYPPRGQWQQVPGPPRQGQYPPVASVPTPAPQPSGPVRQTPPPQPGPPRGPVKETPAPGPIRQTPAPAPAPAPSAPQTYPYPTGGIKPSKPVTPSPPAPSAPAPTAPAPAPAYPYPTGGIKPSKDVAAAPAPTPAPAPAPAPPAPAPAYPYPTGGIKPSKPVDEAPVQPNETLDAPAPTGVQMVPTASTIPVSGPGKVELDSEVQAGPVLVFGKTPCFGKCPHYTARLYANGRLQYEGQQYAPVEGNLDLMLDPTVVSRLLQAAEASHFRSFKPEYASGATDMAATTLVINYPDGSTKSVRVEDGAPEELQKLLALVNSQIEKAVGAANDR